MLSFFVLFINKDRLGENHEHRNPSTLIPSLLFSTFRCLGFRWRWPALRSGGRLTSAWLSSGWRRAMKTPWRSTSRNKWPSSTHSSPCWLASSRRAIGRRWWPSALLTSTPETWWPRWANRRWAGGHDIWFRTYRMQTVMQTWRLDFL